MRFETLHSETIYRGRAFAVRLDQVRLPNGQTTQLDIVDHHGAVTLLPVDAQGNIWFIRQYRHPAGQELLELPAGVMEPGEEPETSALREIREETGMAAGSLRRIGGFFLAPGYSTEYMHVFLAQELLPDPLPGDEDEFLQVERIPVAQAYEMIYHGAYNDSKTMVALLLARPYLLG